MMEDKAHDNTEFPVVLGYRISPCRRLGSILLPCVLMVPLVLVIDLIYRAVLPAAHYSPRAIFLFFSVFAGMGLSRGVIAAFECLSPGINVANPFGEVRGIPWEDVSALKRLLGGLVVLQLRKGRYVFPGLPVDVRDRLIAILRETSNARIIGFDQGRGA